MARRSLQSWWEEEEGERLPRRRCSDCPDLSSPTLVSAAYPAESVRWALHHHYVILNSIVIDSVASDTFFHICQLTICCVLLSYVHTLCNAGGAGSGGPAQNKFSVQEPLDWCGGGQEVRESCCVLDLLIGCRQEVSILLLARQPSLRTPLKWGHLSNKDTFSFPQEQFVPFGCHGYLL